MQNPGLDNLLQSMREALEKIERTLQLPSRSDFETMNARVKELARRIDSLEKNGPRPRSKKATKKK